MNRAVKTICLVAVCVAIIYAALSVPSVLENTVKGAAADLARQIQPQVEQILSEKIDETVVTINANLQQTIQEEIGKQMAGLNLDPESVQQILENTIRELVAEQVANMDWDSVDVWAILQQVFSQSFGL